MLDEYKNCFRCHRFVTNMVKYLMKEGWSFKGHAGLAKCSLILKANNSCDIN